MAEFTKFISLNIPIFAIFLTEVVDIIIVSYNHSKFLIECLDSIKNQTFKDFRLHIADDASPDNSAEIIENWTKKNPELKTKLYLSQKNRGLSATLNYILENCTAPFVKIMAADDYLDSKYFENNIQTFNELDNSYKIIFSKAKYVDENSQILPDRNYYQKDHTDTNISEEIFKENFICAPSVMLRRNIFETVGYYDPEIILEDYEIWLKALFASFNFKFINKTLTFYRSHGGNLTATKRKIIHEETVALKIKYDREIQHKKLIHKDLIWLKKQYPDLNGKVLSEYKSYPGKNSLVEKAIEKNTGSFALKMLSAYLKLTN